MAQEKLERIVHIAICDDMEEHRKNIQNLIIQHGIQKGIEYNIKDFSSETQLYESDFTYDILFLDILLEHTNGVEVGCKLRKKGNNALLIFVTSSREYAIKGYEAGAFRYLLKPIEAATIQEVLEQCLQTFEQSEQRIMITCSDGMRLFNVKNIMGIESLVYTRKRKIYLQGEELLTRHSLTEIYAKLSPYQFVYVNKGVVVNLEFVQRVEKNEVELGEGVVFYLSRKYKPEFVRKFHRFLEQI